MQTRTLGKINGLRVSALGLGCMGMSDFYGNRNDEESLRTLKRAYDLGVTFYDTADMYGYGDNETLLGRFLENVPRTQIVLATKFGIVRDRNNSNVRGIQGSAAYVKQACEASLKRLKTDYIDLYYQHRVDPNVPIEETVGALKDLIQQGKIRGYGLSEAGSVTIRRAHKVHPITAIQSEYSLWSRDMEDEIIPLCREMGIGFVPYSPLGRGFLTGQFKKFEDLPQDDYRRFSPRFQGENFQKNLDLVKKIDEMAKRKSCTPSQLALAWVLAQGDFIAPIPGTKRVQYLEENLGALKVEITQTDLQEIDRIAPKGVAAGERYPEEMMKSLGR